MKFTEEKLEIDALNYFSQPDLLSSPALTSINGVFVAGTATGRIRAMSDENGNSLKKAGPSTPVEILGLNLVPSGGDLFAVVKDEKKARQLVELRKFDMKEITNNHNDLPLWSFRFRSFW